MLLLLLACVPAPPDTLLVLDGDAAYAPTAVPAGRLSDPFRLEGELLTGYRGGSLRSEGYAPGGPMAVDFVLDEGVAVPLDLDGLVLWSFHSHLDQALTELADQGHDLSPLFPVRLAWSPASVLDFKATENAAWASGMDLFVLFPDALAEGVPLAANEGVVRHELGHAWMEHLGTGGDGTQRGPWFQGDFVDPVAVAVGEGFADAVACLGLDDPRFFDASFAFADRAVDGDAVATAALYEPEDPYALGTVYASLAWDLREEVGPEVALAWTVAALQAWIEADAWEDAEALPLALAEAARQDAPDAACLALALRFPELELPAWCS